jgi:hypothetical protein
MTFYPGTSKEINAAKIIVGPMSHIHLRPMNVPKVQTVPIKISVSWADGSLPISSDLLFHNMSYSQAVIGDVSHDVFKGEGEFILPLGYEYQATALVQCDAGDKIINRESNMIPIDTRSGSYPSELKFILPGPTCRLWMPQ